MGNSNGEKIKLELDRDAVIYALGEYQKQYKAANTKGELETVLRQAGSELGYKPVFRCLIMGKRPEDAVMWGK